MGVAPGVPAHPIGEPRKDLAGHGGDDDGADSSQRRPGPAGERRQRRAEQRERGELEGIAWSEREPGPRGDDDEERPVRRLCATGETGCAERQIGAGGQRGTGAGGLLVPAAAQGGEPADGRGDADRERDA